MSPLDIPPPPPSSNPILSSICESSRTNGPTLRYPSVHITCFHLPTAVDLFIWTYTYALLPPFLLIHSHVCIYTHIHSTKSQTIGGSGGGSGNNSDQGDTPTAYGATDGGYVHAQDEELPYQGMSVNIRIEVFEGSTVEMVLAMLTTQEVNKQWYNRYLTLFSSISQFLILSCIMYHRE